MLSGMVPVLAAELSGTLNGGEWTFSDGTLTVSSEFGNILSSYKSPWKEAGIDQDIRVIMVEEGVSSLPNGLFSSCTNLEELYLPFSIDEISYGVFNSEQIKKLQVHFAGSAEYWETVSGYYNFKEATVHFYGSEDLSSTFEGCEWTFSDGTLTLSAAKGGDGRISFSGYDSPWYKKKFDQDIRVIVVEEGITGLDDSLFSTCENVEELYLPLSLERMDTLIYDAEGLQVYYPGSPYHWKQLYGEYEDWLNGAEVHCQGSSDLSGSGYGYNWTFSDGTLTISLKKGGDGKLSVSEYNAPWWEWKFQDDIQTIAVEEGIVWLNDGMFQTCDNVKELYLPSTIEMLDDFLFSRFHTEGMQVYYTGGPRHWDDVSKYGADWLDGVEMHYYYNYPVAVTLDPCGGTVKNAEKTVIYDKSYGSLPTPSRPGYTFGGWYLDKELTTKVTSSTKVEKTNGHTLYAKWLGKTYTVSFDPGSYPQKVPSIQVTAGGTYEGLPVLTQVNQTFLGWFTERTGGQRITEESIAEISSNITLYGRWSSGSMDNFYPAETYGEQFADVSKSDWYYQGVSQAFSYGLITGMSENSFAPKGNITLAQAITIAARLHKTYFTGSAEFTQGNPWYQVYVDYAKENGILKKEYADYNKMATRAEFAEIFSAALPKSELPGINTIEAMAIPDVDPDAAYADALYVLYRAGILLGSDAKGTYRPASNISRCEAATLLTRMANPDLREKKDLSPSYTYVYDAQGKRYKVAECLVARHLAQGYRDSRDATSVQMTRSYAAIEIGEALNLTVLTYPVDANAVTWKTSNSKIATVDANGRVVGKASGKATITATTPNGLSSSCTVEVYKRQGVIVTSTCVDNINSVDGVDIQITWRNTSGKVINYVNFYVQVLDLNGRVLANEIGGRTTFLCYVKGPIKPHTSEYFYGEGMKDCSLINKSDIQPGLWYRTEKGVTSLVAPENAKFASTIHGWDAIMYNGRAASVRVSSVVVEYADGTTETIYNPRIDYVSEESDRLYHKTYMDALLTSEDNQEATEAAIDKLVQGIWKCENKFSYQNYLCFEKTSANTVRLRYDMSLDELGTSAWENGQCFMDAEGRLAIVKPGTEDLIFLMKFDGDKVTAYSGSSIYKIYTSEDPNIYSRYK